MQEELLVAGQDWDSLQAGCIGDAKRVDKVRLSAALQVMLNTWPHVKGAAGNCGAR